MLQEYSVISMNYSENNKLICKIVISHYAVLVLLTFCEMRASHTWKLTTGVSDGKNFHGFSGATEQIN